MRIPTIDVGPLVAAALFALGAVLTHGGSTQSNTGLSAAEPTRRVIAGTAARTPTTSFGVSLCFCGDLDGDGASEVAVGSPGDGGCPGVFIYRGRTGELLRTLWDGSPKTDFGGALCNAGDQDGDGVDDLAVGSPGYLVSGMVEIVSGARGVVIAERLPQSAEWGFGRWIERVSDIDGDGRDELAISCARYEPNPQWPLELGVNDMPSGVALYRSRDGARDWSSWTESGHTRLCRGLGEVNGDCVDDVVVKDMDGLLVVSGDTGERIHRLRVEKRAIVSPLSVCSWRSASGKSLIAMLAYERDRADSAEIVIEEEQDSDQTTRVRLPHGVLPRTGMVLLGVEGDGSAEVVCAMESAKLVFLSLPSGTVQREVDLARGETDIGIESFASGGDFDGDGVPDILVRRALSDFHSWWPCDAIWACNGERTGFDGPLVVSGRNGTVLTEFTHAKAEAAALR